MANPPAVSLKDVAFFMRNVRTRMPFKYGAATLTSVPILHAVAAVEVEGYGSVEGVAAVAERSGQPAPRRSRQVAIGRHAADNDAASAGDEDGAFLVDSQVA